METAQYLPPELLHHILNRDLSQARSLPKLSADYEPKIIEIFFDGKPVQTWHLGSITAEIQLPESYSPQAIEIAIDGELAFLLVGNELVFNRIQNLFIFNTVA
ncbi:hypothetical protein C7B80_30185 [Cyanosarcina cf. burmensis CCALA 770]|nr:hypothetical protein C7B80_30185 [Cyanosarcina cf. burmensis CCALA 770]